MREVGELITGASAAGKPLATLGIDSEVRFASAKDRAAFAAELADAVNGLVAKYHDEAAPGGRAAPLRRRPAPDHHDHHEEPAVMSREFEVTREIDLPAAPDDVWTAITADTAAWQFPTGMEIPAGAAPPEGAPVTTWDPPHRLVDPHGGARTAPSTRSTTRSRRATAAPRTCATSTAGSSPTSGRTSTTRSAATPTSTSTRSAQYLEHFNGRPVTYVGQPSSGIDGPEAAGAPDAMDTLRAALGIAADAAVGDAGPRRRSATPARSTASSTTRRPSSSASAPTTASTASSAATTSAASSG